MAAEGRTADESGKHPLRGLLISQALGAFNEVILRTAFQAALPVIDLRLVCNHEADYSHVSPIEPSVVGGSKL